MKTKCSHCGQDTDKEVWRIKLREQGGAPLYCGKVCSGLGRRHNKSVDEKKSKKAIYDAAYRAKNIAKIKQQKAAWFKNSYDPELAAIKRKEIMPRHIEYCRQPEYKKWKSEYDEKYQAKKMYGEFYESFLIIKKVEVEVSSLMSKQEIRSINGILNKSQKRKRDYVRTFSNKS